MKTTSTIVLVGATLVLPLASFAKGAATGSGAKSATTTNSAGSATSNPMNSGTTNNTAVTNDSVTPGSTGTTGTTSVTPSTTTGPATGNTNFTGTTVYDNGTGTTGSTNTGTRSTAKPNSAVTQQLSLQGIKGEDNSKILQIAKEAGAINPRIENGTLKYSGGNFNQQKFSSSVSGLYPDIQINSTTTNP